MTFRADDKETTTVWNTGSKFNVRSAPGHVCGNCHSARLASARHDLRFLHVKFRIQNVVRNFLALQHSAKQFGSFYADRTDEHRLFSGVAVSNLIDHRVVFFAARFVDAIIVILARHWPVGGNDVDVEFVNIVKLRRFRLGCAGHAGQLLV